MRTFHKRIEQSDSIVNILNDKVASLELSLKAKEFMLLASMHREQSGESTKLETNKHANLASSGELGGQQPDMENGQESMVDGKDEELRSQLTRLTEQMHQRDKELEEQRFCLEKTRTATMPSERRPKVTWNYKCAN